MAGAGDVVTMAQIHLTKSECAESPVLDVAFKASEAISTAPAKRDDAVDCLKGLAIIGVMLHHVSNRRFTEETIQAVGDVVGFFSWSVYAFIFLAGYLHGRSKHAGSDAFLLKRGRRLLIPYFILTFVYAVLYHMVSILGIIETSGRYPETLLGKLWNVFEVGNASLIGVQLYFYPLLFIVSALFSLMRSGGLKAGWVLITTFTVVGLAVVTSEGDLPTTGMSRQMIVIGCLQYALGFYLSEMANSIKLILISILGVIFLGAVLVWFGHLVGCIVLLTPIALLLAFQVAFRRSQIVRTSAMPLNYLGRVSSQIFAFHDPFILQVLLIALLMAFGSDLVAIYGGLGGTVLVCLIVHELSKRSSVLVFLRI